MKTKRKIGIGVLVALFLIISASFGYLKFATYQPSEAALDALHSTKTVTVTEQKDVTIFKPKVEEKKPAILFYQGAFVVETSYSIWAKELAESGYPTYLIHQPLNLAVLSGNKAEKIIKDYDINDYVIGGHSLGGVMASRFAHNHLEDSLKGVFFLASYPDDKGSLAQTKLPVLSLTGSKDGVLNWDSYETNKKNLPKNTEFSVIEGGNHAGFGSYGKQKGDTKATLSNKEQQNQVAKTLLHWLASVN